MKILNPRYYGFNVRFKAKDGKDTRSLAKAAKFILELPGSRDIEIPIASTKKSVARAEEIAEQLGLEDFKILYLGKSGKPVKGKKSAERAFIVVPKKVRTLGFSFDAKLPAQKKEDVIADFLVRITRRFDVLLEKDADVERADLEIEKKPLKPKTTLIEKVIRTQDGKAQLIHKYYFDFSKSLRILENKTLVDFNFDYILSFFDEAMRSLHAKYGHTQYFVRMRQEGKGLGRHPDKKGWSGFSMPRDPDGIRTKAELDDFIYTFGKVYQDTLETYTKRRVTGVFNLMGFMIEVFVPERVKKPTKAAKKSTKPKKPAKKPAKRKTRR